LCLGQSRGFLRDIAGIPNRRRHGLRARSVRRYRNDGRGRRRRCTHDRRGLFGWPHVDGGRLRGLDRRHVIGPIGACRRRRRGGPGHGVLR
jgi:hypothetical protein